MAQLVLTRSYHQYLISRSQETCIPPGVLSFSRAHVTPSATRDPLEIDTNTKQPFPSEIEIDESWSTIRAGPQMAFKDPLGMLAHSLLRRCLRFKSFIVFYSVALKYIGSRDKRTFNNLKEHKISQCSR